MDSATKRAFQAVSTFMQQVHDGFKLHTESFKITESKLDEMALEIEHLNEELSMIEDSLGELTIWHQESKDKEFRKRYK